MNFLFKGSRMEGVRTSDRAPVTWRFRPDLAPSFKLDTKLVKMKLLPKRSGTQFFWAQLSKTLLFFVLMSIIIINCTSVFIRLSISGKLLVFIGNPLEEEATVTGNYTQQVTHTFFFHFNLSLCLAIPQLCAFMSWAILFILQILSLRIFSITFVHMSAYMYIVHCTVLCGLCFIHTGRQVNK